jgi:DNA-directed RNA polymerase sigma subunit (sigma70/sigma32)
MLENARIVEQAKAPADEPEETEEDNQAVEDTAYFQSRQRIADMLSGLSAREAELLSLRFGLEGGLPLSPEDVGKRLGMTSQEVVAMEAAALAKLRKEG